MFYGISSFVGYLIPTPFIQINSFMSSYSIKHKYTP